MHNFKFFHGFVRGTLTAHWNPELVDDLNEVHAIDAEAELTRLMSEEIARGIDDEIISTLTRRINGGGNLQERVEYFERWLDIGGQRA
jgi:uncharacterized protein YgfB (UPF0149 family)